MSMLKKSLPFIFLSLLVAGCATSFTSLSPEHQARNTSGLYPVEVALDSNRQTLRWDSIRASVVVGAQSYPMTTTALMTNRWEGMLPVPAGASVIHYHFRFDFNYNAFGKPKPDSAVSPEYTLRLK